MPLYAWSQTASNNQTADVNVNWLEGQAPSTINNSARGMMAETAKYRDDIAGAIVTTGTSTSYSVTTFSAYDTLAHLHKQSIAFTPHATNGGTTTLNVDSLGAKPLRTAPNTELPAGVLIQGTPYIALYNDTDQAFYLHGFFGNPYNIPIGASLEFWGTTAPNSSFVLPFGQALSRTTYSVLFSILGTVYGAGDGTTTFNIPDIRGRVVAGKDDMGGSAANRLTSAGPVTGTTLGYAGGVEKYALSASEIPTINSSGTMTVTSVQHAIPSNTVQLGSVTAVGGQQWGIVGPSNGSQPATIGDITSTGSNTMSSTNTGGNSHNNVQPTIIANKLLRVI